MRTRSVGAVLLAGILLTSGCSSIQPSSAPLRASLVAEALYGGPLESQPAEIDDLGTVCAFGAAAASTTDAESADDAATAAAQQAKPTCRFADRTGSLSIGGVRLLEPSKGGMTLRRWYLRWTQLYRLWDMAFAHEFGVQDMLLGAKDSNGERRYPELAPYWEAREADSYTSLERSFALLEEAARDGTRNLSMSLAYQYQVGLRAVLRGRVTALMTEYTNRETPASREQELDAEVRHLLEFLAASEQRAAARVSALRALADEEAALFAALREQSVPLAGLQRNITNHLLEQDLTMTPDELVAVISSSRERIEQVRKEIEEARTAEIERQQEASVPSWLKAVDSALSSIRKSDGE